MIVAEPLLVSLVKRCRRGLVAGGTTWWRGFNLERRLAQERLDLECHAVYRDRHYAQLLRVGLKAFLKAA
jgi:hypothetical protein